MKSYSQIGQDLAVLEYFGGKSTGYFVEVGAHAGIHFSNTYLLETLGWNGLCIEPLARAFAELVKNRRCACSPFAAYSFSGVSEFTTAPSEFGDMLSGLVAHIDKYPEALRGTRTILETRTLTSLLEERGAPHRIDYLSIDTEGSELEVLRGIDFEKYSFGYLTIEHNWIEPRRSEMRAFLERVGYAWHRENQHDDDYVMSRDLTKWRPELAGWSEGILEFYEKIAPELPAAPGRPRCVEIGVYQGRSLLFLAEELERLGKGGDILGIDPGETYTSSDVLLNNLARRVVIEGPTIKIRLERASDVAKEIDDFSRDLVFIDGDHSEEGVREDLEHWLPKMRPGGVLGGHDYGNPQYPGVARAVDALLGQRFKVQLEPQTVWWTRIL